MVIATHGNYDRPEWQCAVWRGIVGDQVFVLCPRGKQRDDSPSRSDIRFTYASNQALGVEITAALAALVERFPDHVDLERPLYTGFSLGAIMGVRIAARTPDRFPRLVLVEGGQDNWTDATSRAFAKGGGQRVMFVCSQPQCNLDAASAARRIERAGSKARVVRGPAGDHRYDGPIAQATKAVIAWVLEGDERFGVGDAVRTTPAVP